jgi:P27 family predicted phage terminase small subunit
MPTSEKNPRPESSNTHAAQGFQTIFTSRKGLQMGDRGPIAKINRATAGSIARTDAPRSVAPAPEHLDSERRRLWETLWKRCPWLDDDLDREAVLRYLDDLTEREGLLEALTAEGRTVEGSKGQRVTSPLVAQLRQVNAELGQIEGALGLTSAARTRQGLKVPTAQPSKLGELIAMREARTYSTTTPATEMGTPS